MSCIIVQSVSVFTLVSSQSSSFLSFKKKSVAIGNSPRMNSRDSPSAEEFPEQPKNSSLEIVGYLSVCFSLSRALPLSPPAVVEGKRSTGDVRRMQARFFVYRFA